MEMTGGDHALLATMMALAMGLVKVLEKLADYLMGKKSKEIKAVLDEETARALRDTNDRMHHTDEIVSLRDNDGIPMVYTPRSYLDNQLRMAEALRDVSRESQSTSEKIDEILRSLKR